MEQPPMSTELASRTEVERHRQRLPDDHPAAERLHLLRAAVARLQAVADAARAQNEVALYRALAALDDAAAAESAPRDQ